MVNASKHLASVCPKEIKLEQSFNLIFNSCLFNKTKQNTHTQTLEAYLFINSFSFLFL